MLGLKMAKEITYKAYGELQTAVPFTINGIMIKAYSIEQARLRLAFRIREDRHVRIPISNLIYIMKKSKIHFVKEN